ncbi:DUF4132 domain-containing protein [Hymenobacter bucti]|uniref:DUF4132 domain-containing protein n=1 Tax=Hymenobacter bucti TaxID=1844114 RepID=A0ABW4QT94_9BACT
MYLSVEDQQAFRALLPDFSLLLPALPELPAIITELLHEGRSPQLAALRAAGLAAARRSLLVRALADLRGASLRKGHYGLAGNILEYLADLLQGTVTLETSDLVKLFDEAGIHGDGPRASDFQGQTTISFYFFWVAQTEKLGLTALLPPALTGRLQQLVAATDGVSLGAYYAKELGRLRTRTLAVLSQHSPDGLPVVRFDGGDAFGHNLNEFVASLLPAEARTRPWLHLLQALAKATSSRPSAKLEKELAAATAALGAAEVREQGRAWLALLAYLPLADFRHNGAAAWAHQSYLLEANQPAAKGLVWALAPLADAPLLQQFADLAWRGLRKRPGSGPLAVSLGNAALQALGQSDLPGVAHLARLRPLMAQDNTKTLIDGLLAKASAALGISAAELEDLSVPDYDLRAGRAVFAVGDYLATLALAGPKLEVQWSKAGKALKTTPAALKATHPNELRILKATQAQAQHTYTTQRDRLDRSFVAGRRLPWAQFAQNYLAHGLLGPLARPLIWRLHHPDGTHHDMLWLAESWHDAHGQPLPAPPTDADEVQLWHPVLAPTAEVLAWRELLETKQLRQPLKQAFREVYLLTPPEERTRTYSNRMAAHLLRQHQFSALARGRGWHYRLLGAYDKGYDTDSTTLDLPAHGLQAQFWVSEVSADKAWNGAGIWNYITTDQVRFERAGVAVPLPEVPPLVFSEVMRDVDLFVGVASVGNDPNWRDNGGLPAHYRNHWENYSFGELSEVAKTRKLALERLVPRLKIGKVSELSGRFLVVRGQLRTYKIHLGSGNILMEPNDQYLCIVPDRAGKEASTAGVFLPFEGDAVLSIILSKALLLMDDDQITDETIVRQIR